MSFDLGGRVGWMICDAMISSLALLACAVSYSGSVWPVVNSSVGVVCCSCISKSCFEMGFCSDTYLDKIKNCFFGFLFGFTAMFYCTAAIDFSNCMTTPHSDFIIYYANDQCNRIAITALESASILLGVSFVSVVVSYAIDIFNNSRRKAPIAYEVLV